MEEIFHDPKRLALAGALGGGLGGAFNYATSPYTDYDYIGRDGTKTRLTKSQALAASMLPGVIGGGIGGGAAGYMNKHGYNPFKLLAKRAARGSARKRRKKRSSRRSRRSSRKRY